MVKYLYYETFFPLFIIFEIIPCSLGLLEDTIKQIEEGIRSCSKRTSKGGERGSEPKRQKYIKNIYVYKNEER